MKRGSNRGNSSGIAAALEGAGPIMISLWLLTPQKFFTLCRCQCH
jgi:hypothetical protein